MRNTCSLHMSHNMLMQEDKKQMIGFFYQCIGLTFKLKKLLLYYKPVTALCY